MRGCLILSVLADRKYDAQALSADAVLEILGTHIFRR